jgi:hypothetical protein
VALDQAALLLAGTVLGAVGALLAGSRLYWRLRAKSVRGTVIGVRTVGRLYYAVYRYRLTPSSSRAFEATADIGVRAHPGLIAGRKVRLLVFKKHPTWAVESTPVLTEMIGWGCFACAAVAVGFAVITWPLTTFTWTVLAAGGLLIVYCLGRSVPSKGERPFTSFTRVAPPEGLLDLPVQPIQKILEGPVRAERQRQQRITGLIVTPILVLVGLAVLALGVHLGRTIFLLQSTGARAHGTVLFCELKRTLRSASYYPVVQFATRSGATVQFRDSMGSDPPPYREGAPVEVLYLPDAPQTTATIDRGLLNWLVPGALCVGGLALTVIVLAVRLWVPRSISSE